MGIKHLHQFLRKNCPEIYVEVPLSKYAFRKIAIDISIYMCKFKTSYGIHYMDAFLKLISILRYNDIHFVCVYDSKAPPEKSTERKMRVESRERSKQRVERIRESWDLLSGSIEKEMISIDPWIQEMKRKHPDEHAIFFKFLDNLYMERQMNNLPIHSNVIEQEILHLENTLLSVRSEDFLLTKEFFKICQIPYLDAEGEAEATCSALAKQGYISAVLTEDTDVLAYGCPFMLHRLNYETHTVMEVDLEEILQCLHLTYPQWLDFCILCGTDYNSNLPKIGSDKAYKLIQQYGSIDELSIHMNVSCLNHIRVRELFMQHIIISQAIPYCGLPDYHSLQQLAFTNNCRYDLISFYNSFSKSIFHRFAEKESLSFQPQVVSKRILKS